MPFRRAWKSRFINSKLGIRILLRLAAKSTSDPRDVIHDSVALVFEIPEDLLIAADHLAVQFSNAGRAKKSLRRLAWNVGREVA